MQSTARAKTRAVFIMKIELVVRGNPVRKSNNRIATLRRGRPMVIKSPRAIKYYDDFDKQVPDHARVGITGPVRIDVKLYYSPIRGKVKAKINTPSEAISHPWVGDLSVEAVMDCLQKSGVIADDRQIIQVSASKGISFDNPRVEIVVTEIDASELVLEP